MPTETRTLFAPVGVWSPWTEIVNVLGFNGQVTFEEEEKSDSQVLYEVRRFPAATEGAVEQSAIPGVPFWTYQAAWLRAQASPLPTGVMLWVSY